MSTEVCHIRGRDVWGFTLRIKMRMCAQKIHTRSHTDTHTYVWCPLLRYLQWVWRVLLRVEVDCVPICI